MVERRGRVVRWLLAFGFWLLAGRCKSDDSAWIFGEFCGVYASRVPCERTSARRVAVVLLDLGGDAEVEQATYWDHLFRQEHPSATFQNVHHPHPNAPIPTPTMFGPFRLTNPLSGGLLWYEPHPLPSPSPCALRPRN